MRISLTSIATLIALVAAMPSLAQKPAAHAVHVDFAQSMPTRSFIGFLHGVTESAPIAELLRPLNIQYWRTALFQSLDGTETNLAAYTRLKTIAPQAKIQYLISDEWGYACCRPTIRWPFENYARWETFVADSVRARQKAGDAVAYWEVWNEPTIRFFWPGSMDQFFETYARTYRVLRQQLGPDALIAGPSFHFYDRKLIERFLDYCLANQLEVNVLTWHENDHVPIPSIAGNVQDARASFQQAAKYRPLRIREIHIDEYGGSASKHSPGAMLGYLYYLEAAQPAAAAKSCWKDSKRRNECFNGSLDGLVDVDTMRPRAVWWAYKLYSDGVSSRVKGATSEPSIVVLGSRASGASGQAQVLVGRFGHVPTPGQVDVVLENLDAAPYLSRSETAVVTIQRVASTGEQPSAGPELVQQIVLPLDKKMRVPILQLGGDEVYVLHIAAGPSPRSRARRH